MVKTFLFVKKIITHPKSIQSAYPAYTMGGLCVVGGITGYAKSRSIPSLVAGVGCVLLQNSFSFILMCSSVGLMFLWSADAIRKGSPNGLEVALGMSTPWIIWIHIVTFFL